MTDNIKQVIVVNSDLDLSRGKLVSQACHGSLKAFRQSPEDLRSEWMSSGEKKIVLKASTERLKSLESEFEDRSITSVTVRDAGRTEVEPGTLTCIAAGPEKESRLDSVTGELKLIK